MTELEYYQECRNALRQANSKLLDALSMSARGRATFLAAAKALRIKVRGTQILSPNDPSVDKLFEFALYEPTATGSIWAGHMLDTHDGFSPLERKVVEAALAAEPSLFEVTEVNRADRKVGLHDLLRDRADVCILDLNLSQGARARGLLFCRPVDMESVCFASGATIGFGADNKEMVLRNVRKLDRIKNEPLRRRNQFTMFVELEKHSSIRMVYR